MMLDKYTELILSITSFELFFMALLILVRKTSAPHFKIMGWFLLCKALCVATSLLNNFYGLWTPRIPFLFVTGSYLAFTFGPLLYLFIRSLTSGKEIKLIDGIHFIPLILAFGFLAIRFLSHPVSEQMNRLTEQGILPNGLFRKIYWGFFFIQTLGYLAASWIRVKQYNENLHQHLSSFRKVKTQWLYPVLVGFLIIILVDASNMYINPVRAVFLKYNLPVLETLFLIFANLFLYVGLTQPIIRTDFRDDGKEQRYNSSKLTLADKREILQNISLRMQKDHLFLDPELSIEKLSKVSGTSTRNISQVINEILNQNFFEFVNTYRINLAREQLADPQDRNKTVLEILYAVGFNSKSVFNSCFKKMTGLTPTEYRKQQLEKSQAG